MADNLCRDTEFLGPRGMAPLTQKQIMSHTQKHSRNSLTPALATYLPVHCTPAKAQPHQTHPPKPEQHIIVSARVDLQSCRLAQSRRRAQNRLPACRAARTAPAASCPCRLQTHSGRIINKAYVQTRPPIDSPT